MVTGYWESSAGLDKEKLNEDFLKWLNKHCCKYLNIFSNLKQMLRVSAIYFFPISRFSRFFSQFFGCFSRFLVKFLPIFKVLLKPPSKCLSQSTCSENFQRNIKIRRFSDKNWVISQNVIFISSRTNKTKC